MSTKARKQTGASALRATVRVARLAVALCAACLALALPSGAQPAYAETESFALLADTHLGLPGNPVYDDVESALLWAADLPALRAVCVAGDVTDRGDAASFSEWEFLCASIVEDADRIQALGDHDTGKNGEYLSVDRTLTVANGLTHFKEINGGDVTSFSQYDNVNVITVGGVHASGQSTITASMLKKLNKRLLKTARQGKVALVICHYPYNSLGLTLRSRFMGILRSYPNVVYVSGDRHRYGASAQCQTVAPSCTKTPYGRTGFSRSTKYAFRSIGVNACSTYRSGNYVYADSLRVSSKGAIQVKKWNVSKGLLERTWKFKQVKSSVRVKFAKKATRKKAKRAYTFKVTFSDGGTYGKVKSGSTFKLKPGRSKTFKGIPAGVLVRVKAVKAPAGASKSAARSAEVTYAARTLTIR